MVSLSSKIESMLSNGSRLILIANNPDIDSKLLHNIGIQSTDVVVQFNKCIHHPYIKGKSSKKIYCFQRNHVDSAWGFKNNGEPERPFFSEISAQDPNEVFAISYSIPPVISNYMKDNGFSHDLYIITPGDFSGVTYPSALVPSLGFLVTALCDTVRRRMADKGIRIYLYCVGFSGMLVDEGYQVWHDFFYEQHSLNNNKDIIRIPAKLNF